MADAPNTTIEDAKALVLEAIRVSAAAMIEYGQTKAPDGSTNGVNPEQVLLLAQAWATINSGIATKP